MSEATRSPNSNELTHDGTAERAPKRRRCPTLVIMVAAFVLLHAVVNMVYALLFFSTTVFALPAFFKGLLGIAVAIGLLNLRESWRLFLVLVTGISLPILPLLFLAVVLSSDFAHVMSQLSGVDTWVVKLAPALGFAMFLWMFRTLIRPDVKRAFESREQANLAT